MTTPLRTIPTRIDIVSTKTKKNTKHPILLLGQQGGVRYVQVVFLSPVPVMTERLKMQLSFGRIRIMPIRVFLADFSSSPMNQPFRLLVDGNSARNIGSLFLSAGSDGRSRISGSLNLPSTLGMRRHMLVLSHRRLPSSLTW